MRVGRRRASGPAGRGWSSQELRSPAGRDRGDGRGSQSRRPPADRSRELHSHAGFDSPQSTGPLGGRRRSVSNQSVRAPLSGSHVSRDRPVQRPELLAVGGLYACRERALGNRRRNHAAGPQRSDCQRHRRLVPGRAAVSHLPSPAGTRRRWTGYLERIGVGARLSADRHQSRPGRRSRGIARARCGAVLRHPRPGRHHRDRDRPFAIASSLVGYQPQLALSMDYGYPGNASYRHERPFDHFRIESSISGKDSNRCRRAV